MKIGIEGQRLFREKKHGMDMVALELINNLQKIDKENQYVIFVKPDVDNKCIKETKNFKIKKLNGGPYPLWEQFALPKAALKENCDILHCTSNTAPINTKIPLIITLHDIIYLESISIFKKAGTWYQKFGNMYRRYVVPKVVKKSKKIITVSEFEKNRINNFFHFKDNDKNKLSAVYNGVGEHFKHIEDKKILDEVKKKYNLPDEFIFFLGNTDPKKNTKGILQAYSILLKEKNIDIPLVMLDYDKSELLKLLSEIKDKDLINNIILTGYVINSDLPAIYNLSKIFLYPSLRESFGIPILEAMACGTPVITSNTSSMPEIAGEAVLIIDPFKPEDIADAVEKLYLDKSLCEELINKGYRQAGKFTWKAMAENVLNLYNEVYSNCKN